MRIGRTFELLPVLFMQWHFTCLLILYLILKLFERLLVSFFLGIQSFFLSYLHFLDLLFVLFDLTLEVLILMCQTLFEFCGHRWQVLTAIFLREEVRMLHWGLRNLALVRHQEVQSDVLERKFCDLILLPLHVDSQLFHFFDYLQWSLICQELAFLMQLEWRRIFTSTFTLCSFIVLYLNTPVIIINLILHIFKIFAWGHLSIFFVIDLHIAILVILFGVSRARKYHRKKLFMIPLIELAPQISYICHFRGGNASLVVRWSCDGAAFAQLITDL